MHDFSSPAMTELMRELFPICRSISGDGVRETLRAIGKRVPLTTHEVPSGTPGELLWPLC